MTLPFHPYAELFPLIEGEAFEELVADIRDNGLHDEIVMLDGQILDGRNRYRALCALAERGEACDGHALDDRALTPATSWLFVEFATRGVDGVFSADVIERGPLAFVLSKNLRRRHLDESQRALVAARIATLSPGRPALQSPDQVRGRLSPTRGEGGRFSIDEFAAEAGAAAANAEAAETPSIEGVSTDAAAALLNVGRASVERARVVVREGVAELGKAVERGEIAVSAAAEIARLPVDEQRALIERMDPKAFAAVAKAKRAERQAEKKARREQREAELGSRQRALPAKRYGVIYADPEWRFKPRSAETGMDRAADNHYPTSSTEDIKARRVADIAADDCVLFLWATVPMLREGLEVLAAWGFEYRSHLVWHKRRAGSARGPGYWFTNEHELLLVGVKGTPPCPAPGKQWASLIAADVGEHSVKPDEFAWLIEDYFPNLPKIELNARVARAGWDAWGLEAPATEEERAGDAGSSHGNVHRSEGNAGGGAGISGGPCEGGSLGVAAPAGVAATPPPAAAAPADPPDDEPEIPTFLRRGHADCPVPA
jgi:N6-adenosine-specific RNA methylase IME4